MKNVRYREMNDILKSSDFQHPDTGVPICFVWDGVAVQKSPPQPHLHAIRAPLSRTKAPPASPEF